MRYYQITNHHFHEKEGINKEQCLDFHYNGRHGKHDNLKWYEGSDLPEQHISVKSAKFSLCAGGQLAGDSLLEMLDDYFARVASEIFAYVTKSYEVFEMNAVEFRAFLIEFGYFSRESSSNNGKIKIKAKDESKAMLKWLSERV